MISESEFVMIKAFDRTLSGAVDDAQVIINRKNRLLVACDAEILRLRAALASETGRRRAAELQLSRIRRN